MDGCVPQGIQAQNRRELLGRVRNVIGEVERKLHQEQLGPRPQDGNDFQQQMGIYPMNYPTPKTETYLLTCPGLMPSNSPPAQNGRTLAMFPSTQNGANSMNYPPPQNGNFPMNYPPTQNVPNGTNGSPMQKGPIIRSNQNDMLLCIPVGQGVGSQEQPGQQYPQHPQTTQNPQFLQNPQQNPQFSSQQPQQCPQFSQKQPQTCRQFCKSPQTSPQLSQPPQNCPQYLQQPPLKPLQSQQIPQNTEQNGNGFHAFGIPQIKFSHFNFEPNPTRANENVVTQNDNVKATGVYTGTGAGAGAGGAQISDRGAGAGAGAGVGAGGCDMSKVDDYCTSGVSKYICPPDRKHHHWSPYQGTCRWPDQCPASCFDHTQYNDWISTHPLTEQGVRLLQHLNN